MESLEKALIIATLLGIFCLAALIVCIVKYRKSQKEAEFYKFKYEEGEKIESTVKEANEKADDIVSSAKKSANSMIESAKKESDDLITAAKQDCKRINEEKDRLMRDLSILNQKLDQASAELIILETTVYEGENVTSEEFKDKLAMLDIEYKDFIKSGEAVDISASDYETKKRLNDNVKQILRCFNSEASSIISSVNASNVEKMRGNLSKAFQTINSIFNSDGLSLKPRLLEMRLRELNLVYSYQQKKAQEQEEQKEIRAQMLEEEKARREIEREKAKLEKEEIQFKNEVDKLMKYLSKANDDVEKQLYVDKIHELEEKLRLLEKDKENILEREQNTRAGFVYIISNIGSFGEDIYKIGMTRRLEPMDRVKELGDASVPFEFDVHAMIFSEDAPALETILHNTFKEHQVNLVNPRKEFYKVSLSEIEKVVKENYNATVTFTQIAEAAQYRESVRLRNQLVTAS